MDPCCLVCGSEALHVCGGCARAPYCSANCAREDWPRHDELCRRQNYGIFYPNDSLGSALERRPSLWSWLARKEGGGKNQDPYILAAQKFMRIVQGFVVECKKKTWKRFLSYPPAKTKAASSLLAPIRDLNGGVVRLLVFVPMHIPDGLQTNDEGREKFLKDRVALDWNLVEEDIGGKNIESMLKGPYKEMNIVKNLQTKIDFRASPGKKGQKLRGVPDVRAPLIYTECKTIPDDYPLTIKFTGSKITLRSESSEDNAVVFTSGKSVKLMNRPVFQCSNAFVFFTRE